MRKNLLALIRTHDKGNLDLVIHRMLNSKRNQNNPAYRAHATRALNAYSKIRALEIGSTPARVAAGVRAAVTKRMAKS
ncbi:hypothetical protein EBZ39_16125 [bacterium]|nr:hypothetical protein [bacterium]